MAKTVRVRSYVRNGKRVRAHTRRVGGGASRIRHTSRHFDVGAFEPFVSEFQKLTRSDLPSAQAQTIAANGPFDAFTHIQRSSSSMGVPSVVGYRAKILRGPDGTTLGMRRDPFRQGVNIHVLKKGANYVAPSKPKVARTGRRRTAAKEAARRARRTSRFVQKAAKASQVAKGAVVGGPLLSYRPLPTSMVKFKHARTPVPRKARGLTIKRSPNKWAKKRG